MLTSQQIQQAKNTRLSENFTLFEMINSSSYPDMVAFPSDEVITQLKDFCENILQPLRDKFGPIKINSGYRNPRLNKAVGGVANSIHKVVDDSGVILGVASDIVPLKADLIEVYNYMAKNIKGIKTVILYRKPSVTRTPFIHVDNRHAVSGISKLEKIASGTYVPYAEKR